MRSGGSEMNHALESTSAIPQPLVLPPSVAREVDRLADELAGLIVASGQSDQMRLLSILLAAVSDKVGRMSPPPDHGAGDPLRTKVPVPAQVVEQAQRQFNEEEV